MEIHATGKYLRISPKKLRDYREHLVGLSPDQAIERLAFVPSKSAIVLSSVIKSALSNAKNNAKLDSHRLKIKTVEIYKGPFLKRFRAVGRGMAHQIKKRMSHVKVTLAEAENPKHEIRNTKQ